MQGDEPVVEASVDIGGPVSSAWREELLMRAHELRGLRGWLDGDGNNDRRTTELLDAIDTHLGAVRDTAAGKQAWPMRLLRGVTGASFERTLGNLDAAEVDLLRIAPSSVLIPALPSLLAHINRYLSKDDPRRQAVERIARDQAERPPQRLATRLRPARPAPLLDDADQILGWAVVFGIAQQLVTQFADSQASGLLENVKGRGAGGDRELKG